MDLILTRQDCQTLIKRTELPSDLRRILSKTTSDHPIDLTPSDLSTLTILTLRAYGRHNRPESRQAIKKVMTKILSAGEDLFSTRSLASSIDKRAVHRIITNLMTTIPNWANLDFGDQIKAFNKETKYTDVQDITESLELLIDRLNNENQSMVAGLSPNELATILHQDWSYGTPGVQLQYDLTTEDVVDTTVLKRSQILLRTLEKTGTKATNAGNLNRRFVRLMVDKMDSLDERAEYLGFYDGQLNEADVPALENLRAILELAELIEIKSSHFQVAGLGEQLIEPGSEGHLFLMLFVTWFRDFNLAYGDDLADSPEFQDTLGYSLYRLSLFDNEWQNMAKFAPELILPSVSEDMPILNHDYRAEIVESRLLKNLELFGLVELQRETSDEVPSIFMPVVAFRKTKLFDRFIGFGFEL